MAKFRIIHRPPGEKSNKNVVRVKVYDLKPKTDPKGGDADEESVSLTSTSVVSRA